MKRFIALVLGLCLVGPVVGCTEKTEVKSEKTVTTPEGETTTTKTETIEKSGENPPPAEN